MITNIILKHLSLFPFSILCFSIMMWSWISSTSYKQVSYEIVQQVIKNPIDYYLINTLPLNEQESLIVSTLDALKEESILNEMLSNVHVPDKKIVVYGKNAHDENAHKKAVQMQQLGIKEVFVYSGGLFEWMLLQDIYGKEIFPTTKHILDILHYKPSPYYTVPH